mgnify:CR=1 FL=1
MSTKGELDAAVDNLGAFIEIAKNDAWTVGLIEDGACCENPKHSMSRKAVDTHGILDGPCPMCLIELRDLCKEVAEITHNYYQRPVMRTAHLRLHPNRKDE